MSDPTQTPEKPADQLAAKTTEQPAPKNEGSGYDAAFTSLKSENQRLAGELAALQKKLGDKDRELGEARGKIEGFVRKDREGAIISKIRTARADLDERTVRGHLLLLAEEGKVDRFAEDADAASKAALDALKEISPPELKRSAAPAGGPGVAPQQPSTNKPNKLDALFGIK